MKELFLKQVEITDGHWLELSALYDSDYNGDNGENKAVKRINKILDKYRDNPLSDDEYFELIFDDIENCLGSFASQLNYECAFVDGIYIIAMAYIIN